MKWRKRHGGHESISNGVGNGENMAKAKMKMKAME
jgi:hypothetical protein